MNDRQQINLATLLEDGVTKSVRRAERLLDEADVDSKKLMHLLRDFREEPIAKQSEIRARDDIDNLLTFYSRLEVSCICRFVPDPLPRPLVTAAKRRLNLPAVRRFYTKLHPQLLPQSFHERLAKRHAVAASEETENLAGLFMRFDQLSQDLEADDDIDTLLWFLDDGFTNGIGWKDVKKCVSDPHKLTSVFARPGQYDEDLVSGVVGYRKFISFCLEFQEFLWEIEGAPLVQSAAWHYHAYWFDHLREKVGPALEKSLAALAVLAKKLPERERSLSLSRIQSQQFAVNDLLTGNYGDALQQASDLDDRGDAPAPIRVVLRDSSIRIDAGGSQPGYDPSFLDSDIPLPKLPHSSLAVVLRSHAAGGAHELKYRHYSVVLDNNRRLALLAAGNYDPQAAIRLSARNGEGWSLDGQVRSEDQLDPAALQSLPELLVRGQLFAFGCAAWGASKEEARLAGNETYYLPNCSLILLAASRGQGLNAQLWDGLEKGIVGLHGIRKMSIFSGHCFSEQDPSYGNIQAPLALWKVLVVQQRDGQLSALAFMLRHASPRAQPQVVDNVAHRVTQVRIEDVEHSTGLSFGPIKHWQMMPAANSSQQWLRSIEDIVVPAPVP